LIGVLQERSTQLKIKLHVVHVGLSQLLLQLKEHGLLPRMIFKTYLNNNLLIVHMKVQLESQMMVAMVDGWIMPSTMLLKIKLKQPEIIHTKQEINHAHTKLVLVLFKQKQQLDSHPMIQLNY
jgi:hypothetical protein